MMFATSEMETGSKAKFSGVANLFLISKTLTWSKYSLCEKKVSWGLGLGQTVGYVGKIGIKNITYTLLVRKDMVIFFQTYVRISSFVPG